MTDTTYQLPVMDTIKTAWAKIKGVKKSFWAILGIVFAVEFAIGFLSGLLQTPDGQIPAFMGIVSFCVAIVVLLLSWGMLYMGIQRAADQPVQYRMVGYVFNWSLLFRMIGLYILQGLILFCASLVIGLSFVLLHMDGVLFTLLGIVLYVIGLVAALFLAFRMYLAKGFVIARQMGPVVAIKASFAATLGNVWRLLGLTIVSLLIFIVSAIPLGIGLIWSLPFLFVNYGEVFKRMTANR